MGAPQIVVIGAGVAGTAAAWRAARRGASVTVVHAVGGATALYSGAADLDPWERAPAAEPVSDVVMEFSRALGVWRLGATGLCLATLAGVLRPARAADRALLDLSGLAGQQIAVADVDRDDWDAPLLAAALSTSPWATSTGTQFVPVRVSAIRAGHERRIAALDFACLLDDADRLRWFAEQLRVARPPEARAWLAGPWLGLERDAGAELRAQIGIPIGETTSLPGGVAGARFERARDRLFEQLGLRVVPGRAERLEPHADGVRMTWSGAEARDSPDPLQADAVIVATGGLVGGGLSAVSAELVPGAVAFQLSIDLPGAEVAIAAALDAVLGCDVGADFQLLERVGIRTDGARVRGLTRVFAAGDVRHGPARTVLAALQSGIDAADAALAPS
jgi:anaerobic glycerol-3-phosphate dehydrogenase